MNKTKMIVLLITFGFIVGCNGTRIQNPLPELRSVAGPTGNVGYLDFVRSTVVADLKGWENAEVYFRYATSANAVKSTAATELTNICSGSAPVLTCSATFPNAWTEARLVFPVGTTVFYQWFIDYRLPEGNDTATVESPLRSFSIVEPQSCVSGSTIPSESCPTGQVCVRDPIRADPTGATLAPTVCRIPEPG